MKCARVLTLIVAAMLVPHAVGAEPPRLRASIVCESPASPGRFRCDVEVRAREDRIAWADVVVASTDDFILPLRGRLGPRDASTRDVDIDRWSLGFVAKARGGGDVTVRVRAVVCAATCEPVVLVEKGHVVVGG